MLVLVEADTALAPLLARLMDHNEDRQAEQPAVWQFEQEFIVDFIHKVLSILVIPTRTLKIRPNLQKLKLSERFPETAIRRAAGILSTNSTSLQPGPGYGRASGLYPVYSLMNHSCW